VLYADFREFLTCEVRRMEELHLARVWGAAMFQNPSFMTQFTGNTAQVTSTIIRLGSEKSEVIGSPV
jgi:hypothetical protein